MSDSDEEAAFDDALAPAAPLLDKKALRATLRATGSNAVRIRVPCPGGGCRDQGREEALASDSPASVSTSASTSVPAPEKNSVKPVKPCPTAVYGPALVEAARAMAAAKDRYKSRARARWRALAMAAAKVKGPGRWPKKPTVCSGDLQGDLQEEEPVSSEDEEEASFWEEMSPEDAAYASYPAAPAEGALVSASGEGGSTLPAWVSELREEHRRMGWVVAALKEHPMAGGFLEPVDPDAANDYYEVRTMGR